jgi:transmembrane sensor
MQPDRIWQLLSRKMDGEASMDELRELEQLLMNLPEDAYKIDIVTSYIQKKHTPDTLDEEETQAWEKHIGFMSTSYPEEFNDSSADNLPLRRLSIIGQLRRHKALAFSLMFTAIIVVSVLLYRKQASPSLANSHRVEQLSAQNSPAHPSKTKMVLPDGTQVWLNGNSHVTYQEDFGKNNKRDVVLTGEAFFEVTHNARTPFYVHAKTINIKVKGTAFNVKAYPEDKNVETSLLRGMVEVSATTDPKRKFILKPSEKITIAVATDNEIRKSATGTKQSVENNNDNKLYHIDNLKPEPSTSIIPEVAWLQNKLVFNGEPLSEIVEKMQRWYGATIEIKDDRLKDLRFTGAFSNETLPQALNALQATYPFETSIGDNTVTLYIKQ